MVNSSGESLSAKACLEIEDDAPSAGSKRSHPARGRSRHRSAAGIVHGLIMREVPVNRYNIKEIK